MTYGSCLWERGSRDALGAAVVMSGIDAPAATGPIRRVELRFLPDASQVFDDAAKSPAIVAAARTARPRSASTCGASQPCFRPRCRAGWRNHRTVAPGSVMTLTTDAGNPGGMCKGPCSLPTTVQLLRGSLVAALPADGARR